METPPRENNFLNLWNQILVLFVQYLVIDDKWNVTTIIACTLDFGQSFFEAETRLC